MHAAVLGSSRMYAGQHNQPKLIFQLTTQQAACAVACCTEAVLMLCPGSDVAAGQSSLELAGMKECGSHVSRCLAQKLVLHAFHAMLVIMQCLSKLVGNTLSFCNKTGSAMRKALPVAQLF